MTIRAFVTYKIFTNPANTKYLKSVSKNIKQTEWAKNGIPQNNGADDLGGQLNFIRVFGGEFSKYIDFDKFKFNFALVKGDQKNNEITLCLDDEYPEGLQEMLTSFLGKSDPNLFIFSNFNTGTVVSGLRFTSLKSDHSIYSKGFSIVKVDSVLKVYIYDNPVADEFFPKVKNCLDIEKLASSPNEFRQEKTAEILNAIAIDMPHKLDFLRENFGGFVGLNF